jgi:hypothetical protein
MVDVTRQIQGGDLRVLALVRGQPESDGGSRAGRPERRSSLRAATSFAVCYRHQDRQGRAAVTSLGPGGLFLEVHEGKAGVGDEIDLEWSLPGDQVPVRARGVVVWTRSPSPQGRGGLGVRFSSTVPDFAPVTKLRAAATDLSQR